MLSTFVNDCSYVRVHHCALCARSWSFYLQNTCLPTKHKDGFRWYKTVLIHLRPSYPRRTRLRPSWGHTGRKKTVPSALRYHRGSAGRCYGQIRRSFSVLSCLSCDGLSQEKMHTVLFLYCFVLFQDLLGKLTYRPSDLRSSTFVTRPP